MDTDLLKTFLEVRNTRHFGKAAENLYLTPAAVSARIKQLEKMIGSALFTRYRNNLQLTATGDRLVPHAEAILIAWDRAQQDIALKKDERHIIGLGATNGLWDLYLQEALVLFEKTMSEIALRAESQSQEILIRRLVERTLDFAVVYEPPKLVDLISVQIATAKLTLVGTSNEFSLDSATHSQYVSIDWGTSFNTSFCQYFPDRTSPKLHTNLARIALEFILKQGGSAYLPLRMIDEFLGESLFIVEGAPEIERPIYAVYHDDNTHTALFLDMIEQLKSLYDVH